MAYTFNPFTGKLDAVGSGGVGATGATGIGTTGATGVEGSTGATGAVAPGGSVGAVDNSVLRADVGTGIVQNSGIIIDDVVTATQDNVAIRNNSAATNSALVLTPKGTGALIAGPKPDGTAAGGNLRGTNAVDLQAVRGLATQVASGLRAFIGGGTGNTASQSNCVALGAYGAATGVNSFAIGLNGGGSVTCTALVESSVAVGYGVRADRFAMIAYAQGQFSAQGDAQRARFVLRCKTTTNTAVQMALDGITTYLGIPSGKVIACTINISGVSSTGGAVAHYVRQYAVKNVGGTSGEVYAPVTIGTDNAAGTVIALSANNGDDTLRIAVTGIAAETWRWVASVDAVEIAYGT